MKKYKSVFEMKKLNYVAYANEDIIFHDGSKVIKLIYAEEDGVEVRVDTKTILMNKDEIYLTRGDEAVVVKTDKKTVIYMIESYCKYFNHIKHKIIGLIGTKRHIIYNINEEYKKIESSDNEIYGYEQMMTLFFEQLFILLIRENIKFTAQNEKHENTVIVEKVVGYLNDNIYNNIKFEDVVKIVNISATGLKKIFKDSMGDGVMKYYNVIKNEKAKKLLSEGEYNVSQVSEILGYESIHYFSRQFKKTFGVSPGEYLKK